MQAPEPFDDLDFNPGKLLDHRYQIVALLGEGGMGRVYRAFHVHLDTPVALKALTVPEEAPPEEQERAMRRFCREARLLTRLRHPNIPRVLDYFPEDSTCYLVMDYVEGQTLAHRLGAGDLPPDERALPLEEALNYASQLCSVLVYLHSQEPAVVFGDLKPSNVILTPDGRAVMVDFGIARHSASQSETPPWQRGLGGLGPGDPTSETQPLGTPGYAAPEQYEQGQRADPRSDIFALGVLLYEMVTGKVPPPFPFGFQPVRQCVPHLPLALEDVIDRALRFDPAERFQTAGQMLQALRRVSQGLALQAQKTEEIPLLVEAADEAMPVILPAAEAPQQTRLGLLRRSVLISVGGASLLALLAVVLLIFGLSGSSRLAQRGLGHPLAAAPVPTDTNTPQPTATPSPLPTTPALPQQPASPEPTKPPKKPTPPPTEVPSPSPTPTRTPTQTPTPSPSPAPTPTATPGLTPTPTRTPTPSPSPAPTPTASPSSTPSTPGASRPSQPRALSATPLPAHQDQSRRFLKSARTSVARPSAHI